MTHTEAINLIKNAEITSGGVWADLGAGGGTFTFALAEILGEKGQVFAVDRKTGLSRQNVPNGYAQIYSVTQDFTGDLTFPSPLDGVLMANSLHYVARPEAFLTQLKKLVAKNASLILVEYDRESGNPWVPYPISFRKLELIAENREMSKPVLLGRHPSRYAAVDIYAAQVFW